MENSLVATIFLGLLGSAITYYYSKHTKKIADEQMLKQLFTEFNKRYDELNNYLSIIAADYQTIDLLNNAENSKELNKK